jgi:hypothetical protein
LGREKEFPVKVFQYNQVKSIAQILTVAIPDTNEEKYEYQCEVVSRGCLRSQLDCSALNVKWSWLLQVTRSTASSVAKEGDGEKLNRRKTHCQFSMVICMQCQ